MVAGRMGHDPAGPFLGRQGGNLVVGPPDLEGPDALEVFRLQEDGVARAPVKRTGGQKRCPVNDGSDDRHGMLDIGKRDHGRCGAEGRETSLRNTDFLVFERVSHVLEGFHSIDNLFLTQEHVDRVERREHQRRDAGVNHWIDERWQDPGFFEGRFSLDTKGAPSDFLLDVARGHEIRRHDDKFLVGAGRKTHLPPRHDLRQFRKLRELADRELVVKQMERQFLGLDRHGRLRAIVVQCTASDGLPQVDGAFCFFERSLVDLATHRKGKHS